jgi:DNA-binding transcriptional ArsR family regulator
MKRAVDPDIRLLQAAADPTRLAILRELTGGSPICACDFTSCCDVAQPTVSHHLKVLREAGWVSAERRGTWVYYQLNQDAAARFGGLAGELVTDRTQVAGAADTRAADHEVAPNARAADPEAAAETQEPGAQEPGAQEPGAQAAGPGPDRRPPVIDPHVLL